MYRKYGILILVLGIPVVNVSEIVVQFERHDILKIDQMHGLSSWSG